MRNYTDLSKLKTFEERFEYLRIGGPIGIDTFGSSRYLNQAFYKSPKWLKVRNEVIIRDNGCDLGIEGREIFKRLTIHHMEPITLDDVVQERDWIFDPEYLISVSDLTHKAIHYGDISILPKYDERKPGDTKLW